MIGPTFAGFTYDAAGSLMAPPLTAAAASLVAATLIFAGRSVRAPTLS